MFKQVVVRWVFGVFDPQVFVSTLLKGFDFALFDDTLLGIHGFLLKKLLDG